MQTTLFMKELLGWGVGEAAAATNLPEDGVGEGLVRFWTGSVWLLNSAGTTLSPNLHRMPAPRVAQ